VFAPPVTSRNTLPRVSSGGQSVDAQAGHVGAAGAGHSRKP